MPTYEYRCTNPECGQTATDALPVDDRDMEHECGECGSTMRRLFGNPAVTKMIGAIKGSRRPLV